MHRHPIVLLLLGWLLGSFVGLGQLMGLVTGMTRKTAPAAA